MGAIQRTWKAYCDSVKGVKNMTGYELLKAELIQKYNASKVSSNEGFIRTIITLLSEGDDKIALDVADQMKKEAEQTLRENQRVLDQIKEERRTISKKEVQIHCDLEKIQEERQQIELAQGTLSECETPEGRDKIRLANFFMRNTDGLIPEPRVKGLSNILGNGGTVSPKGVNDDSDKADRTYRRRNV